MIVERIPSELAYDLILNAHYAHRIPPITYSFGLFINKELLGVVTYGTPLSHTLRQGIAGIEFEPMVIELNRLVLINKIKNGCSFLISNSIKLLPKPKIIVSYADTELNHNGYVYQASNFLYTGLSAKISDYAVKGKEHKHHRTIYDESRGKENRIDFLKNKYGDNFYMKDRSRKHRYLLIHADKKTKKSILHNLKYKILPYPKNKNENYKIDNVKIIRNLF